jgi:hypothetical protein
VRWQLAEVEAECEALLQQATTVDASSPEPLQVLASLRNEQGRAEEALEVIKRSVAMWLPPEGADDDDMVSDVNELPSFEFRFEAAKLLLDVDTATDTAIRILIHLLQENDTVIDGECV